MNSTAPPVTVSSLLRGDEAVILGFVHPNDFEVSESSGGDGSGSDGSGRDGSGRDGFGNDGPDPGALERRLAGMGLAPGIRVTVLRPASGSLWPTLLAIGETRIAIGRELSDRITVAK